MDSEENSAADEEPEQIGLPAGAGETLRTARLERRLSLDHVAAETRIPIRHLESLERGDFQDLPSRTYALGFARNFARVVKLDETHIVDMVREEMGEAGLRHSAVGQGMEPGDPAKLPSRGLAWAGGAAALLLAVGAIAFGSAYFGAGTGPGSLLGGEDTGTEQVAEAQETTTDTPASSAPTPDGEVVFTALGESGWVRFYENDGDVLFEGVMEEGETYTVPSDAQDPWINTGRANQYAITIGGQTVPVLAEEMVQLQAPVSAEALLAREPT